MRLTKDDFHAGADRVEQHGVEMPGWTNEVLAFIDEAQFFTETGDRVEFDNDSLFYGIAVGVEACTARERP